MDTKILLLFVLAASFLMFGCAGKAKAPAAESPGEMAASDGSTGNTADDSMAEDTGDAMEDTGAVESGAETAEPHEDGTDTMEDTGSAADAGSDEALADLFQIDTDKPISDEGLDVSTPSSD